jgi:hypothetical protein
MKKLFGATLCLLVIAILVFASSFESLRVSFGSIFGSGSGGTAGSTGFSCILGSRVANPKGGEVRVEGV